eukprot:COSAG02_NODE_1374_length_13005_cov_5.606152_2_plen_224_part_00
MRARWSTVPSRVREDVRKDRQKWLEQQARGEHAETMPHEIVESRDDSEPVDTAGGKRDPLNLQDKEAGWLGFDDAIVTQQCQPQTHKEMVDRLADDRLSRYFEDAETTEATGSPLDRHLGAHASNCYKPRAQPEPRGANAATAATRELQNSPDSQECVPLASIAISMATFPSCTLMAFYQTVIRVYVHSGLKSVRGTACHQRHQLRQSLAWAWQSSKPESTRR